MQEQVNEKTVALTVKGAKLSGQLLAKAMQAFLRKIREPSQSKSGKQMSKACEQEQADLREQTTAMQAELDAWREDKGKADSFVALVQKYTRIEELTVPIYLCAGGREKTLLQKEQ